MGGFGHMCIEPNGELCSCGRKGCWETLASESATIARYHRLMSNKNGSITTSITDIIAQANRGDEKAPAALTATAEYLGEGIASLAHGLSPETIVIGGEIAAAWPLIGPIINERVKSEYIIPEVAKIEIRPASVQRPSLFRRYSHSSPELLLVSTPNIYWSYQLFSFFRVDTRTSKGVTKT